MQRSALIGAALAATGAFAFGVATSQPRQDGGPQVAAPQQAADLAGKLVPALEATEGCLGVETAQTASGKSVVMAWFEDGEAARRWYNRPVHLRMVRGLGVTPSRAPLEHVEDDQPVMVIAALTTSEEPGVAGAPIPISQLSIELYAPLPGGAPVNGRLAPDEFPMSHMADYTPAKARADSPAHEDPSPERQGDG